MLRQARNVGRVMRRNETEDALTRWVYENEDQIGMDPLSDVDYALTVRGLGDRLSASARSRARNCLSRSQALSQNSSMMSQMRYVGRR